MQQCDGCDHLKNPDGGWCYMFREIQPGCRLNTSLGKQPPLIKDVQELRSLLNAGGISLLMAHCDRVRADKSD